MRKSDLALMKQLKREEKTKRDALAVAEAPSAIEFDTWWANLNKSLKLPFHLKEIVWADFQARGLKGKASPAEYDAALRLFGYQI